MNIKPFKCLHSGKCCSFTYVQINLTIGDIIRLSDFLKKTILEMFNEEIIGFMPFFDTNTMDAYDVELGLIKPCKLHINNRCSVYPARPLNCRIFPYFIISNFNKADISKIFPSDYKCVHRIELNKELKEKYKIYSKQLGEIILNESEMTKRLFDKISFHMRFKMDDYKDELENSKNISKEKLEEMRIKFFISKIPKLKSYEQKIMEESELFRKDIHNRIKLNI
jgi:Fe-S-cluster containining protein